VQGGQVGELTKLPLHDGVDDHRGRVYGAPVYDAMANGIYVASDAGDRRSDRERIEDPPVGLILGEQNRIVRSEQSELQAGRAGIYYKYTHRC
jgi:hypothetical protein